MTRIYALSYNASALAIQVALDGQEFEPLKTNHKRATFASEEEMGAVPSDVLLRLGNHLLSTDAEIFPENGKPILWDALQNLPEGINELIADAPASTTSKKKKKTDLQSDTDDGTSASPGDAAGGTQEDEMKNKAGSKGKSAVKKKAVKKAAKKKVAAKKNAAPQTPSTRTGTGGKSGKTAEVKRLLLRKNGATRADILGATGWPSVSVQQIAKNTGLKLRAEKDEKTKRMVYYGTE